MNKKLILKKIGTVILVLSICLAAFLPTGCGGDRTDATSAPETTADVSTSEHPETTADVSTSEHPETTLAPESTLTPETTPTVENTPTPETTAPETPPASETVSNVETPSASESVSEPETVFATESPSETETASEPETTPEPETPFDGTDEIYSITYELDGGIGADENPDTYTYQDGDITLFVPIKKGFAFAGWIGTGLDGATEKVVIPTGSFGDRVYTATWKEVDNVYNSAFTVETTPETPAETEEPFIPDAFVGNKDANNGIATNPDADVLSKHDMLADNGSGIFLVKTAYTNITVDGVMDNAYTYGLHFTLDLPEKKDIYASVGSTYDAYLVMGQDGKMHVYVNVIDHDIVINDEQWAKHWWHCDVWQMYMDYGNDKDTHFVWSFAAEETKKYTQNAPENWIVVMTNDGFAIEYEFDNDGKPFVPGDMFGFSFFYNDSWDYVNTTTYGRSNTRTGSVLVPATGSYQPPDPVTQDGIMITSYPIDYEGELIPEEKEEGESDPASRNKILYELASRQKDIGVAYSNNSSAHLAITSEKLAANISSLGIFSDYCIESSLTNPQKYGSVLYFNYLTEEESINLAKELHYAEYGVKIVGNKIIAIGWQANAITEVANMVEAILSYAVSGGDVTLVGTYTEALPEIPGENVPKVDGAQWITDSGDDAYVVHKLDTDIADYDGYKALLEAAGYKLHVENAVATVKNATYYSDDTVINVLYSTADRDLRVSVEPMYNTALPMLAPEEYETVTESSVTLLNPNNLTMIVRLANGEFIVIDSGNRYTDNYIYNELKKQQVNDGPIVIAAWIFTHFHQDHQGGFIDYTLNPEYMADTVIKSIIYNFPEKQVLDTASKKDQINLAIWPTCINICREKGATLYQARTGQKYYFGNATLEILHTYDDLMPFFVRSDNTNHTNILFCIDIEGQRIMVTGDLTNPGFLVAANRYGSYLKSDILQVAHHGYGDGSNDTTFYGLVDAEVVFVPGSGYQAAQKWAVDNAKEVYIRSHGTKTLMLPHAVAE